MWAEIHVFEGRMYVTGIWGSSGGVPVADTTSDGELGQAILVAGALILADDRAQVGGRAEDDDGRVAEVDPGHQV